MPTSKIKLFLDLDGVFANFNKRIEELANKPIAELNKNELWKLIGKTDDFFISLELIEGSEELWNFCLDKNPTFLTGAPSDSKFCKQKIEWVRKTFGTEFTTIVLPSKHKQFYSYHNCYLIDDRLDLIEAWNTGEGIGVHHTGDFTDTIKQLQMKLQ